ncbi:hypothetical protein [Gordonia aichiensis]|uniref:hypothetical protein n=1 Tax=Gordonia aichiensis TaxID=36820 RepID=UPI003267AFA1
MSITFFPEMAPVVGYQLRDFCDGRSETFSTYEAACEALADLRATGGTLPGCTDPDEAASLGGPSVDVLTADDGTEPEVRVTNQNARTLLPTLGITEDCGTMDAEQFLGAVLLAQALTPTDEGIPVQVAYGPDGCIAAVNCGRPAGYLDERLTQLEEVATWAIGRGRRVCWS